jgi:hypothetical protein
MGPVQLEQLLRGVTVKMEVPPEFTKKATDAVWWAGFGSGAGCVALAVILALVFGRASRGK